METNDGTKSNEQRRRDERVLWRRAFAVSVILHLLLFAGWKADRLLQSPFSAAGPRAGDNRAAAGSMQSMNLRVPPSVPIVPPPVPLPTLEPIEPLEFEEEPVVEQPEGLMGDATGLEGPGLEDGTGLGDGGTSDEGRNRLVPPRPRGMIIPHADDALRGREVEIWVFVDATGRVVPDSTVLRPPTSDRDFNRSLVAGAASWVFEPARMAGEPVASWFDYSFRVGGSPGRRF